MPEPKPQSKRDVRVLGINGSPNRGTTHSLLVRVLSAMNVEGEIAQLPDLDIRRKMLWADCVVFGTPTHWFNCSVPMKELIDSLTDYADEPPYPFEGKVAAFLASCNEDGAQQAISAMMLPLNHMGFIIPPFGMHIYNASMPSHGKDGWQDDLEGFGGHLQQFMEEYLWGCVL